MEGNKRHGGRKHAQSIAAFAVFGLLAAPAASAFDFSFSDDDLGWGNWGQVDFTWNTRLTAGAQVRTERRDYGLVDKQNNPQNQNLFIEGEQTNFLAGGIPAGPFSGTFDLCEIALPEWVTWNTWNVGDCFSQAGDPRPSQRLINAPGGYNINGDDGNLNYDRGDITYANIQVRSELTAFWRNFSAKISGIGYYDPVNNDFDTHLSDRPVMEYSGRARPIGHPDFSPGQFIAPVQQTITIDRSNHTERRDDLEDLLGNELRLLEAFVAGDFEIGGRTLRLAVGDQRVRWGESTFMIFNNLARINPPSARLYDRPGTEVRDAFIPVGMVTASMNVTKNFNFEAFYQYDWEPVEPSVCGSFLAVSDVAGCGDGPTPIYLASGNAPEAPNADFTLGGISGSQTTSTRTIYLEDESFGYPDDGGQFGLRLDYYADWLNGGTELSLYGMNIHSRLPFFSVLAADEWCQPNPECPRFGEVAPPHSNALGRWRVDTMRAFLDYPEDIRIFGLSGTTNFGDWSLAGEVAYSPNQPAQVSLVDVVYAGIQPALIPAVGNIDGPYDDDIDIPFGNDHLSMRRTPVSRIFAPDYLESRYRCDITGANVNGDSEFEQWENEAACSDAIEAGQYIRGYERLKVGQVSLTGIRVLGSSSLFSSAVSADQIIFVGELAGTKVFDMPGLNELQFQGSSANMTHYSQGQADWNLEEYGPFREDTDEPIPPEEWNRIDEVCDDAGGCYRKLGPTDRANPERADEDIFADDFAWGYRMRITADYNNGPLGWKWTPGLLFYHDVHGTSISPGQDFVEDRKELTLSTNILFTNEFSANLQYRFYWGAGDRNLRQDRDYAEFALNYSF